MLSSLLLAAAIPALALAQGTTVTTAPTTTAAASTSASTSTRPLAALRFNYPNLPYQADPNNGIRGRQNGYNLCNSTTENQDSLCQTAFVNSISDFCIWGAVTPNSIVGDIEGSMVAWCTQPGHGTRLIPQGTLEGVQYMRTPHYAQIIGRFHQENLNIATGDYGGELDPHGADQRGNPLGGLMFSNIFGPDTVTGSEYKQVVQWTNFVGADLFCIKVCDPSYEYGYAMCEHIFDRIGCVYNMPADYSQLNGTFQACQGDDQLYPGVYVTDGQTRTYTQPPESLGVISTIPYVPFTPASSSCTPFSSAALYAAGPVVTTSSSSAATNTSSSTAAVSTITSGTSVVTVTSSSRSTSGTGTAAAGQTGSTSSAAGVALSPMGARSEGVMGAWTVMVGAAVAAVGAVAMQL